MKAELFYKTLKFSFLSFVRTKKHSTGRSYGRITSPHRASGLSFYLSSLIDYERKADNQLGFISYLIRRKFLPTLSVVIYEKGFIGLILAPENIKRLSFVLSSKELPLPCITGYAMALKYILVGLDVHSIMFAVRSSGTKAKVLRQEPDYTLLKLPSGLIRRFPNFVIASLGALSNSKKRLYKFAKAGQTFVLGKRPHVRGTAMNPVDHPHGGGQGKTSGGRPSVTPKGRLTKGYKTNRKNKRNAFLINN